LAYRTDAREGTEHVVALFDLVDGSGSFDGGERLAR